MSIACPELRRAAAPLPASEICGYAAPLHEFTVYSLELTGALGSEGRPARCKNCRAYATLKRFWVRQPPESIHSHSHDFTLFRQEAWPRVRNYVEHILNKTLIDTLAK